jgi:hypothetical protein
MIMLRGPNRQAARLSSILFTKLLKEFRALLFIKNAPDV